MTVRILIIDDDTQTRSLLRQMLERAGYAVEEAGHGSEGLRRYRAAPTALVITDLLMPDRDGLETIRELRQAYPEVKILAISGGGQLKLLNFLTVAEKLGAQHTLRKPFRRQELLDAVRTLLQGHDEGARASPEDR